jgi:hypothetical protein
LKAVSQGRYRRFYHGVARSFKEFLTLLFLRVTPWLIFFLYMRKLPKYRPNTGPGLLQAYYRYTTGLLEAYWCSKAVERDKHRKRKVNRELAGIRQRPHR